MPGAILAALCATVFPVPDAAGEGNLARRAEHQTTKVITTACTEMNCFPYLSEVGR